MRARWQTPVALMLAGTVMLFCARPAMPMGTSEASTSIGLWLPGMTHRGVVVDAPTLFHTLEQDFAIQEDGSVYVQTGDIPAMWLRDSSAQTIPYIRFASVYPRLGLVARGVIQRNARNILTSSYANAFTAAYKLWEEKWEVDSLAYPILLAGVYWRATHDRAMYTMQLHWAYIHIVQTYECEQQHATCSNYRSRYLTNHGSGEPFGYTGMVWSAFRPSDDPVRYPYNIPQQLFAAAQLEELAHEALVGYDDRGLARRARDLAAAIRAGVERYGQIYDFRYGWMYAYEVDGLGDALLADDANIPNLLTLPLLGLVASYDPLYVNSRRFSLSSDNPYYYSGRYAAGLGSPHTPTGWVWPLAIVGAGLTATSAYGAADALTQLRALDGERGLLHESIDPDRPWHFTRNEFGWANALYAELIFRSVAQLAPQMPPRALRGILPTSFEAPKITTPTQAWDAAATIYSALHQIVGSGCLTICR